MPLDHHATIKANSAKAGDAKPTGPRLFRDAFCKRREGPQDCQAAVHGGLEISAVSWMEVAVAA